MASLRVDQIFFDDFQEHKNWFALHFSVMTMLVFNWDGQAFKPWKLFKHNLHYSWLHHPNKPAVWIIKTQFCTRKKKIVSMYAFQPSSVFTELLKISSWKNGSTLVDLSWHIEEIRIFSPRIPLLWVPNHFLNRSYIMILFVGSLPKKNIIWYKTGHSIVYAKNKKKVSLLKKRGIMCR